MILKNTKYHCLYLVFFHEEVIWMRVALIDIGSNTVKIGIYRVHEDDSFTKLAYRDEYVGLYAHIQHGEISEKGMNLLVDTLVSFLHFALPYQVDDTLAFATAALRGLTHPEILQAYVLEQTGIWITIISGEQESYYDFLALRSECPAECTMLDLGGGSGQILICRNSMCAESVSLPIGSLKLFEQFVSGHLPEPDELDRLRAYVRALLQEAFPTGHQTEILYVMSGTARALRKVCSVLHVEKDAILETDTVQDFYDEVFAHPENYMPLLSGVVAERLNTLFPGSFTIMEICRFFGCQRFYVSERTIKDGFLQAYLDERKR